LRYRVRFRRMVSMIFPLCILVIVSLNHMHAAIVNDG